jgi:hypothetical protein
MRQLSKRGVVSIYKSEYKLLSDGLAIPDYGFNGDSAFKSYFVRQFFLEFRIVVWIGVLFLDEWFSQSYILQAFMTMGRCFLFK